MIHDLILEEQKKERGCAVNFHYDTASFQFVR